MDLFQIHFLLVNSTRAEQRSEEEQVMTGQVPCHCDVIKYNQLSYCLRIDFPYSKLSSPLPLVYFDGFRHLTLSD